MCQHICAFGRSSLPLPALTPSYKQRPDEQVGIKVNLMLGLVYTVARFDQRHMHSALAMQFTRELLSVNKGDP